MHSSANEEKENFRAGGTGFSSQDASYDSFIRLTELAKLHADGVLSDKEFKALKAKLISAVGDAQGNDDSALTQRSGLPQADRGTIKRAVGHSVYVILFYTGVPVFLLVGGFLFFSNFSMPILGEGVDLKLESSTAPFLGNIISIQNVGSEPITILDITINERQDCHAGRFALAPLNQDEIRTGPSQTPTLKAGDAAAWSTNCNIVRVNVRTDRGSRTYSFGS